MSSRLSRLQGMNYADTLLEGIKEPAKPSYVKNDSPENSTFYRLKDILFTKTPQHDSTEQKSTPDQEKKMDEWMEQQKQVMIDLVNILKPEDQKKSEIPACEQQNTQPTYQQPSEAEMSIVNGIKERENYNMRMLMLRGSTQQKALGKALKRWDPAKYRDC